jgi:hypothetical protein
MMAHHPPPLHFRELGSEEAGSCRLGPAQAALHPQTHLPEVVQKRCWACLELLEDSPRVPSAQDHNVRDVGAASSSRIVL